MWVTGKRRDSYGGGIAAAVVQKNVHTTSLKPRFLHRVRTRTSSGSANMQAMSCLQIVSVTSQAGFI